MTPDERDMLSKSLALAEENNAMLKKIKGSQRMANITRWLYWLLIIGMSVASFYLIQPYINAIQGAVGATSDGSTPTTPPASGNLDLNSIINEYKQATQ